jgi:hypothetical protein
MREGPTTHKIAAHHGIKRKKNRQGNINHTNTLTRFSKYTVIVFAFLL